MGSTLDVRSCLCVFAFLLLFADVSEQRTVRGEEGSSVMEQFRDKEERLFRPPALLEDLLVPEGQLQPPFSSNHFEYNVTVAEDVEIIHVTAKLALGKENDKFRVRMTSSNLQTDMYGSTLSLTRNASTIDVRVHVSSHKCQTSTYLLRVVSGPASHEDTPMPTGGADKKLSFVSALLNTFLIFGSAMAVSALAMFLYGTLATLRSRQQTVEVEGYQPVGDHAILQ